MSANIKVRIKTIFTGFYRVGWFQMQP